MRACRTIKPVIIISASSVGDRFEHLSKMSRMLVRMFDSIESHVDSFTYLFSKYSKDESLEIHRKFRNLKKNMPAHDKSNKEYNALIDDMIKKTIAGAIIIDPINDNPVDVLEKIIGATSLTDPNNVIHDFVTGESREILNQQIYKHA